MPSVRPILISNLSQTLDLTQTLYFRQEVRSFHRSLRKWSDVYTRVLVCASSQCVCVCVCVCGRCCQLSDFFFTKATSDKSGDFL